MRYLLGLSLRYTGGIVAAVTSAGILHHRWQRDSRTKVLAESVIVCPQNKEGTQCVAGQAQREVPICLKLRQVQVAFCPGACTPVYTLDGFKKATYKEDLVARHHFGTIFPYRKLSKQDPCSDHQPEWSAYEKQLQCQVLPGGSKPGQLSSYGQEQMFDLGLRLKEAYRNLLKLCTFSPEKVRVTSPNVKRNVISTRCVLAGIFGREQLAQSARQGRPVEITVEDCDKLNLLTPDTEDCCVLQKVNLAAKNLHGNPPFMREDRDKLEERINIIHAKQLFKVTEIQERYDKLMKDAERTGQDPNDRKELGFDSDRLLYLKDERVDTILAERHEAIDNVELFWHNVFSNHPFLSEQITKEDFDALSYLRRIEIQDFNIKFDKGTRYKFYFDTNPYFHNKVLVKEVHHTSESSQATSRSTPIIWKPCFRLYPSRSEVKACGDRKAGHDTCNICGGNKACVKVGAIMKPKKKLCVCADGAKGPSFFAWFVEENDQFEPLGVIIKHDAWMNPMDFYVPTSYSRVEDNARPSLDFVALRDDVTAREAHGYSYPNDLKPVRGMAEENATRILYYATCGQHKACERELVTRMTAGRFLNEMMEKMLAVYEGKESPPLHLYSCPHGMMTAMLEALGMWDFRWPDPASDLSLELFEDLSDQGQFYVRVLYNGQEMIPRGQCESLVHLGNLCKAVKPYTATQMEYDKLIARAAGILKRTENCYEIPKEKKCRMEVLQRLAEVPAGM